MPDPADGRPRGTCRDCDKNLMLNKDGKMRRHVAEGSPSGGPCSGSWLPPSKDFQGDPMPNHSAQQLAGLSAWIDNHPDNAARDREAQLWGRVSKVGEEFGEAIAALIGVTGQNPRKGVTHSYKDLGDELLDIAVTALGAYEHIQGNTGIALAHLAVKIHAVARRAGLVEARS